MERNPRLLSKLIARLGRKYESYWYAAEKREWRERDGWPASLEDWKKVQGWIVRKKLKPEAATRATFTRDIAAIFRDVYPLLRFTSLEK